MAVKHLIFTLSLLIAAIAEAAMDVTADIPKFTGPILNVTVPVGREAVLECGVDNLSNFKISGPSDPILHLDYKKQQKYYVAWLRVDTQTILTIHSHVITKNHRIAVTHSEHRTWYLHIRDVRESDRGWYMCQINTDPMKSQIGYLDVVVPPDILDYPTSTDMVVREGSNVSLRCAATGSPEPTIAWRREGGENIPLGNGQEVPSIDGTTFNISKVNRLHMGPYLCIASNGVPPSVSKRIMLRVHFPPMIWIQNQLVGAMEGQQITLECHSEAYPRSINYWTMDDGNIISEGAKYEPVLVDNAYKVHMKLTIRSVSFADYGSYKCVAKNSLGETDGTIKLYHIPSPSTQKTTTSTTVVPINLSLEKVDTSKQHSRPKEPAPDPGTNEIFDPETTKERDLRLRSNPSETSQDHNIHDSFFFSAAIRPWMSCLWFVTIVIVFT
ncbi:neurotrimin-like isoform X1 [Tribolium madens]|uniref:neurotrimin-like isoform X1 n=1 Tax=Tribolium madens TaxID=41895 RepID=UPI001CF75DF5|nr:neurotrimin-like isoform X1 [Tribolium madens]